MLDLFPNAVPRPSLYSAGNLASAVEALLPEIERWLEQPMDDSTITQVRELLTEGLASHSDGYEFARDFERAGFSPNAALVEILDGASGALYRAQGSAVAAWVRDTGRRPRLAVGTAVVTPDKGEPGEIVRLDSREGTYTVRIPSRGHVPVGTPGTAGLIWPWEVVEAANEVPADAPVAASAGVRG
jgi:hypothetical protein